MYFQEKNRKGIMKRLKEGDCNYYIWENWVNQKNIFPSYTVTELKEKHCHTPGAKYLLHNLKYLKIFVTVTVEQSFVRAWPLTGVTSTRMRTRKNSRRTVRPVRELVWVGAGWMIDHEASPHLLAVTQSVIPPPEPVFLNVYGAQESIPRNVFRQPT
jgi:hypothetical protein